MVSSKGKLNANLRRVAEDHRIIKNVGMKDIKVYLDAEKIKVRGPEYTAKSLSVTKECNQTESSDSKVNGNVENPEKSKGKHSSSVNIKLGRKALADVSNVRNYLQRNRSSDGSKPVKSESAKILYGLRISVRQRTDGVSGASSKYVMGKVRGNQSQGAENPKPLKNTGTRDSKVYSNKQKTNGRNRESFNTDGGTTARKPPMLSRKSLPVTKRANRIGSSDLKGSDENSEKGTGNTRNHLWRNRASDGFISVRGKSEKGNLLPRVAPGQSTVDAYALSRKPFKGKVRGNQSQVAENHQPLKNTGIRDFKFYSNKPKTKGQNHESLDTIGGATTRKPLMLTRKSFPVTKRTNGINSSDIKDNDENSVKGTVTVRVGRKVVPDVSNAKSYPWRNRASDGYFSMKGKSEKSSLLPRVPVGRSTVECALPRKPTEITRRTTLMVSNARMISKSKCTLGFKKSTSATASLSKNKKEGAKAPVPENTAVVVSHEPASEKLPSDADSYLNTTMADIKPRTRCSRRRSYTSLLMARSKVLGDHAEGTKQDELPSIDDNSNHLEVSEYVDEIYQYYWIMEAQNPSLSSYMAIQTEITPEMRGILVNWLIEVHFKFELMQETLFLMVTLLDRFISKVTIKKKEMQLVGLTALLLASKYEDFWHPKVTDLLSISANSYTRDQMLGMEKLILKKLMFRLNAPTPYVFMLRFLKAAKSDAKVEHLAFYLIELSLVEYEALKFKPSHLCAAAIYLARCTLQISPAWTKLLSKHAHYEESEIRDCADMILRFQKAAGRGLLKVTYEKYMHPDHSCTAAIKAMDKLPL